MGRAALFVAQLCLCFGAVCWIVSFGAMGLFLGGVGLAGVFGLGELVVCACFVVVVPFGPQCSNVCVLRCCVSGLLAMCACLLCRVWRDSLCVSGLCFCWALGSVMWSSLCVSGPCVQTLWPEVGGFAPGVFAQWVMWCVYCLWCWC